MLAERTRIRIASRGFDPVLTGIATTSRKNAGDFYGAGLRVPYQPTGTYFDGGLGVNIEVQPYLFQIASVGIGDGFWLTGVGLLSLLGVEQPTVSGGEVPVVTGIYPNTIQQQSALFNFADCKPIRWGLRRVSKPQIVASAYNAQLSVLQTDSFAYEWTDGSGLIFETALFNAGNIDLNGTPDNYLDLIGYRSPSQGLPGRPLNSCLGSFDSLDYPYAPQGRSFERTWVSGDGPGDTLVLYALVEQTNPSTRGQIIVPGAFPLPTTGIPESAFLGDFTDAYQYSVGGWIEIERPLDPMCLDGGSDNPLLVKPCAAGR